MNGSAGAGQDPAVGRTRRGHRPGDEHIRRVLEAVVLVRPGTSPIGGWGG
jgi:hypothetical protein